MTSRTIRVEPIRCYQLAGCSCMEFKSDIGPFTEVWLEFEREPHHIATFSVQPSTVSVAAAADAFRAGVEHGRNWAKNHQHAQDCARHKAGM